MPDKMSEIECQIEWQKECQIRMLDGIVTVFAMVMITRRQVIFLRTNAHFRLGAALYPCIKLSVCTWVHLFLCLSVQKSEVELLNLEFLWLPSISKGVLNCPVLDRDHAALQYLALAWPSSNRSRTAICLMSTAKQNACLVSSSPIETFPRMGPSFMDTTTLHDELIRAPSLARPCEVPRWTKIPCCGPPAHAVARTGGYPKQLAAKYWLGRRSWPR